MGSGVLNRQLLPLYQAQYVLACMVGAKMGQLYKRLLLMLVLTAVLHDTSGAKKGSVSKNTSKKTSQGSKSEPNPPRQPSSPAKGKNPGNTNQQNPGKVDTKSGGYPVRTAGDPRVYPVGGGYPNWNPNNKILSPRYGGTYGAGRFGTGGSPFSHSVQSMGYGPSVKSKGFAKQAMVAAGAGTLTGMAVGYGVGQFPRPDFQFNSPQEEYYYNNYMYRRHGINSDNKNDKERQRHVMTKRPNDQTLHTPKQPTQYDNLSYDQHMNMCMKTTDLDSADHNIQRDEPLTGHTGLDQTATTSPTTDNEDENDDTVSILKIGYPALTEQMKARKCIEMYLVNSESFQEKPTEVPQSHSNSNRHFVSGLLVFLTTFMCVHPSSI